MSKYPELLAELMRRGYTDDEIKKVAGDNLLRAMEEMVQVFYESIRSPDRIGFGNLED